MKSSPWARNIFLSVWAVLMTALTVVLGAVSLKALRSHGGRWPYWGLSFATVLGLGIGGVALGAHTGALQMLLLSVIFLSLVLLVGLFSEFEEMGMTLQVAAFFALAITVLAASGGFALWASVLGPGWTKIFVGGIDSVVIKPLLTLNSEVKVTAQDIAGQLPSIVIMAWLGALYLAVALESRVWGRGTPSSKLRTQLFEIKMPDAVVWVFILALLGSFFTGVNNKWVEVISINALNLTMMLFFFQGIAVISKFFTTVCMSGFWQMIFMVFIVVNLFIFVSLLGLVDHWIDFRSRMAKRAQQFNKEA